VSEALPSAGSVPADLVRDVSLLCLDAGNTVIFLDHARLAAHVARVQGENLDATTAAAAAARLVRAEGEAKRLAETGELVDVPWSSRERPGASAWGKMVATIAVRGGMPVERASDLLDVAWRDHEVKNLWCKVPEGLGAALDAIRARGVKVAIISNSEGMLDRLFGDLGILGHFDEVVDSGKVGVEKPDPRIFRIAMDHFGASPADVLHLGDVFATDVLGARAAGIRHALIDPFGHYEGRHPEVARVPGAVETARAILAARG